MPCDCAHRADASEISPDDVEEFVRGFARIQGRGEYELLRCTACESLWIVDQLSRGPIAVRCASIDVWRNFDDAPYRRRFLIDHHGGFSETKCLQRGCSSLALRGVAFCPDHISPFST